MRDIASAYTASVMALLLRLTRLSESLLGAKRALMMGVRSLLHVVAALPSAVMLLVFWESEC
jgi:hypothetical protein